MRMRRYLTGVVFAIVTLAAATAAFAQAAVTETDIARLDTTAGEIRQQVATLKTSDPTLAADVEKSLGDLSDEITYLRVKLKREGSVSRDEYASLRDRLETLRVRAQGDKVAAQPALNEPASTTPAPTAAPASGTVPVGAELDVRLQASLSSATAKVEQRFDATTTVDYATSAGAVLIPAGSIVRGFVSSVSPASHLDRRGSLTLSFDELRIGDRSQPLRASVLQALDGKGAQDNARLGAGAAVGAIIGGILGGGKGALLGVLVGGGGTMAATAGADVELPAGTILRIRVDQPVDIAAGAATPAATTPAATPQQ
ncbi:MAG TPA: hypothetical protein VHD57_16630 [Vicinamibacterales bacterium]|jgi:hypothetical protein|nr:hypothetical protein [Vicinamibacterales bacterium]